MGGRLRNQRQEYVAQHGLGNAWPAKEHVKGSVFHYRDTCVSLSNAALFTIARGWSQLSCPSTEHGK